MEMANSKTAQQLLRDFIFLLNKHKTYANLDSQEIVRDLTITISRLAAQTSICNTIVSMEHGYIAKQLFEDFIFLLNKHYKPVCVKPLVSTEIVIYTAIALSELVANKGIDGPISLIMDGKIYKSFKVLSQLLDHYSTLYTWPWIQRDEGGVRLLEVAYNTSRIVAKLTTNQKTCNIVYRNQSIPSDLLTTFNNMYTRLYVRLVVPSETTILFKIACNISTAIACTTANEGICSRVSSIENNNSLVLFNTLVSFLQTYGSSSDQSMSCNIVYSLTAAIAHLTTNQTICSRMRSLGFINSRLSDLCAVLGTHQNSPDDEMLCEIVSNASHAIDNLQKTTPLQPQ